MDSSYDATPSSIPGSKWECKSVLIKDKSRGEEVSSFLLNILLKKDIKDYL